MADPLGGDGGAWEHPPPYVEDVDGGPLGGDAGAQEHPAPYVEDIDGGPLGGDVGGQEGPPHYVEDVDSAPLEAGSRFHLLSKHALVPARSSSICPHQVQIPGPRSRCD
jgi:hypothetical protein